MPTWYVSRRGQKEGPYSDAQLKGLAVNGTLTAADLIWKEGLPTWVSAGRVRGLFPQPVAAPLGSNSPASPSISPPPLPPPSRPAEVPPFSASTPARDPSADSCAFGHRTYTVRRKAFKLFGGAFFLLDESNAVIGYSKQKAFKLKEDIRVFTDEQMTSELLTIQARNIVDFSATYDVCDPMSGGKPVGSLRRKGWKSMVRDEWLVFGPDGGEIGMIREDGGLALVRRFIAWVNLISPQRYSFSVAGKTVAWLATNRNPFVYRIRVSLTSESAPSFAPQLVLAGAILLAAIEGKQA
jgi:hypothetical protein